MVNIPPIKMVMTGGLFMTLLYQHYTKIMWEICGTELEIPKIQTHSQRIRSQLEQ